MEPSVGACMYVYVCKVSPLVNLSLIPYNITITRYAPFSTPMSPYTATRSGSAPPAASAAASGAVRTEKSGEAHPSAWSKSPTST